MKLIKQSKWFIILSLSIVFLFITLYACGIPHKDYISTGIATSGGGYSITLQDIK